MSDEAYDPPYLGGGIAGSLEKAVSPRALSLRKKIELQKQGYEEQIKHLDELLKLLDENPAIEKFQNLSAKIRL